MKKVILSCLLAIFTIHFVSAQIDRSKPPKATEARSLNFGKVNNFTMPNGLKVIVVENHKLPTVRMDLYFDNDAIAEGNKAGMNDMFGEVLKSGTKNFTKEQLDETMDILGTDFWSGANSFGFSSLKKQLFPSLDISSEILFNPTFSNKEELGKLKKQSKTDLESGEKNPDVISNRVTNVLLYGKNDPWGEYKTPQTIDNIQLQDFKTYYDKYFSPSKAYLTFVGDITLTEAKLIAEKYFSKWKNKPVAFKAFPLKKTAKGNSIALVDLPSATQSLISVIGLNNFKKSNKLYHAGVLGNDILGGGSFGRLFKNIREDKGWTYGAYSNLDDDAKRLGSFSASAKVRNSVTDSAVVEFMKEIKNIAVSLPSNDELNTKKSEYNGNFTLSLERPETVARFVRTQMTEKLGDNFYKDYLKNINNVSSFDIVNAMKQFVDPNNLTILIVGKAEEIYPKLQKLGYPIKFYDIYGNPAKNPTEKVMAKVSAKQVVDNYIQLAGGKDKLSKVNTLQVLSNVTSAQIPIPMTAKESYQTPNKIAREITGQGMTLMKEAFNGTTGYQAQMGQSKPFDADELKEYTAEHTIFPQLYYDLANAKVETVTANGEEAYKIKVSDKKTEYFSTKTGMLIKEEILEKTEQGDVVITIDLSNYQEVEGIKLPFTANVDFGGMIMKFETTSVAINKNVTDADFN